MKQKIELGDYVRCVVNGVLITEGVVAEYIESDEPILIICEKNGNRRKVYFKDCSLCDKNPTQEKTITRDDFRKVKKKICTPSYLTEMIKDYVPNSDMDVIGKMSMHAIMISQILEVMLFDE